MVASATEHYKQCYDAIMLMHSLGIETNEITPRFCAGDRNKTGCKKLHQYLVRVTEIKHGARQMKINRNRH